jgi:hypothetical protein
MAAVTAAAIAAGATIYASNKASKDAKKNRDLAREGIAAADPYAQYRPDAAAKLNALMSDPSSISNTAEYKSRQQAAARQLAAQGYTGSGNAIAAAAEAGGASYQQAFNNLSVLSGAGVTPGGGYGNALQANQASSEQQLSAIAGIGNSLSNLALTYGNRNKATTTPTTAGTPSVVTNTNFNVGPRP